MFLNIFSYWYYAVVGRKPKLNQETAKNHLKTENKSKPKPICFAPPFALTVQSCEFVGSVWQNFFFAFFLLLPAKSARIVLYLSVEGTETCTCVLLSWNNFSNNISCICVSTNSWINVKNVWFDKPNLTCRKSDDIHIITMAWHEWIRIISS